MDRVLKDRKMASATARRRRGEERELARAQERSLPDDLKDRKRRILLYGHSDDEESDQELNDDECDSFYATSMRQEAGRMSSMQTPSETSLLTPNDTPSPPLYKTKAPTLSVVIHDPDTSRDQLALSPHEEPVVQKNPLSHVRPPPSPRPVLHSSLITLSDWNYERFSAIFDPVEVEAVLCTEEDHEPYSPLETATPISYSQPRVRPSVISIISTLSTPKIISPAPSSQLLGETPSSTNQTSRHVSQPDIQTAFPASEATLFEIPKTPPDTTRASIDDTHHQREQSQVAGTRRRLERKTSAPLLSIASKFHHERVASTAGLSGRTTSLTLSDHQHRPSASSMRSPSRPVLRQHLVSQMKPSPYERASMSYSGVGDKDSRPLLPTTTSAEALLLHPPPTPPGTSYKPSALHAARKKSISALRSRSESIGLALKSARGRLSLRPDMPMLLPLPSTPHLVTPKSKKSIDLGAFPIPPPSPSSSSRKSASLYPIGDKGDGLGLGLMSVTTVSTKVVAMR